MLEVERVYSNHATRQTRLFCHLVDALAGIFVVGLGKGVLSSLI
jgi:hypothetical protein